MRGAAKNGDHVHVMKTQADKLISLGLLTAVAAYLAAGTAVAQTLTTKDKVGARVGVFRGGSAFTPDTGGHTGLPGDRAVDFGTGTGPVYVQDAGFLNALAQNDEITFAFWAKKYDIAAASAFYVNSPSSSGTYRGAQAHVPWSNNNIYWDTAGCCNPPERISGSIEMFPWYTFDLTWWTDNWHLFVFTKKGPNKEIWIDGQLFLDQQTANPGVDALPLPTDLTDLYIGSDGTGASLFHALVDDFSIYGTALSQTSIGQLFSGTLPTALPASDKLTAWWDFNDYPEEGAFVSITPPADATAAAPDLIQIVHMDGTTPWNASSITLKVDGVSVTPTFAKDGLKATVTYVPSPIFAAQTLHKVLFSYPGAGGGTATLDWEFTVGAYTEDVVASRLGIFTGGSAFTPETGGHTGQPGDRAADFGTGTGPVDVKDASFLNALSVNDQMSFAFWMKKPFIEYSTAFWAVSPSSSGGRGYQAHVPWGDGTIYFDSAGCCDPDQTRISANISTFPGYTGDVDWWTNWHHFVFQKNVYFKEIWIDGQMFLFGYGNPLPTDFTELFIGAAGPGVNLMSGLVDDFAIFGTALSSDSIYELFTGTPPTALPATNNLTAYWNFDDFPSLGLFVSIIPAPYSANARPDLIRVIHQDGATAWDASNVTLKVDDAPAAATLTKDGGTATVSYVQNPLFLAGSTHKAALTYPGAGATQETFEWQFTVGTFPVISSNVWTAQGSGFNPGFRIKSYEKGGDTAIINGWRYMVTMANQALAGYYPDNFADLTAFTHDGFYWEPGVINYSGSGDAGNIGGDLPFPGIPGIDGLTGGTAMEVLTFLEFPAAGFYTMGVNSDDGFRVTLGDRVGPDQTIVHVLKPDSLAGDKVGCQSQNGVDTTFGGTVPRPPIVARAVNADPILAGNPDNVGEYFRLTNAAAIKGNIAIVQRGGGIAFNVKAQNCFNSGAIGVVMANNNGDQPGLFGASGDGVYTIPCITVNQADGDALIAAATTGADSPVILRLGDDASLTLGEFITGRGASDTIFAFIVPAAGVYPFRLVWDNGPADVSAGNALSCEWFMQDTAGVKTLINDGSSTVKAWIQRTFPTAGASLKVTESVGVVTLSWTGEGELEEAYSISGPWVKSAKQDNPQTLSTTTLGIDKTFYRVRSY